MTAIKNTKPSGVTPRNPKGDLTTGPLKDHLVRLSVPMIWGIGAIISFQLVDTFYVSMLGTDYLAALSFTFPVGYFIFSFTMGFGIAMSSVLSRLIGSGDQDRVRRVATHGLMLVFGVGILIAALGIAFHDSVFKAMGADDKMLPMIRDYMIPWFAGSVFITLPLVGNAAIRATGDTRLPAMIMGIVALVNVILDPIFIFGWFGFPRMELFGAALATIIANALAAGAGLYVIAVHKKLLCGWPALRFDLFWDSAKRLLFIALPAGLTNAIHPIVNGVILGLLSSYGASAVAAYGVVTRIEAFAFIILMAVSVGMSPIIGQNFGAKIYDRVKDVIKMAIQFSVIWSIGITVVLVVLARPIAEMFSNDEQVIQTSILFFMIVPASYVFSNLISGWGSAFNAMGMPQRSVMMIAVKMLVLMLPAIYIGENLGGLKGILIAMAMVNVVSGIGFHLWNRHTMNRKCTAG
jgi:putative MATE family efflux protein